MTHDDKLVAVAAAYQAIQATYVRQTTRIVRLHERFATIMEAKKVARGLRELLESTIGKVETTKLLFDVACKTQLKP